MAPAFHFSMRNRPMSREICDAEVSSLSKSVTIEDCGALATFAVLALLSADVGVAVSGVCENRNAEAKNGSSNDKLIFIFPSERRGCDESRGRGGQVFHEYFKHFCTT